MSIEIKVPEFGESVTEATVAQWFKKAGEAVSRDEPLCELETDKAAMEINAPVSGTLDEIRVRAGEEVAVGAVLGVIAEGAGKARPAADSARTVAAAAEPGPAAAAAAEERRIEPSSSTEPSLSPAVRKLVTEHKLDPGAISATGKGGRLTKADVLAAIERKAASSGAVAPGAPAPTEARQAVPPGPAPVEVGPPEPAARREERVRMTRLRKRIAERLTEAQNTGALLTTFNEVDMTNVMAVRSRYRDMFEKKHGVRLGFMSFFVKAATVALREFPAVNAEIDGDDIVYKNYYDIGVAVSAPQGLVVPVVRDADRVSFAEIEKAIAEYARKARDGKLTMDELTGGTFTITNGGVFGSLLSTPIVNPPQVGILGMHKIQQRPVAVDGKPEVRPMMYLALTYDHRIIDGREAVSFLVRIKECIEDPERLLLDL
ncbi:MAG: 2-oxoglutarate dehydrogenase complex dihydrolipoyllysine-residue succinyltransferase [Alphaproteobacteria bacterium]